MSRNHSSIRDRRLAALARALVLASAVAFMLPGAWSHSVTVVEVAQLPSGLAALQHHTLGIYRVCGPTSRLLYAIPAYVFGVSIELPSTYDLQSARRYEWDLGQRFQNENQRSYHAIYRWSRLLPILVTLLGAGLICEWATLLFGRWPGVLALCLWCWSPPVLAHGALVTSDVAASVSLLGAARVFWSFLLRPRLITALLAGVTLGVAASTKFTLLILYPCWAFLLVGRFTQVFDSREADTASHRKSLFRLVWLSLLLFSFSIVVIDAAYGFRDLGFSVGQWPLGDSLLAQKLRSLAGYRATAWMLNVPLPIPLEFLRGLDVQLLDSERIQAAYLLGWTRLGGWWYWYPVAALFKLPVPAFVLFTLAIFQLPNAARVNLPVFWASLCLFVPAVEAALAVATFTGTGTNAAFRYLIPSIGLCCVWGGQAGRLAWRDPIAGALGVRRTLRCASILALVIWLLLNAVIALPDHLGWQNELGWLWRVWSGKPALIGDSLDWGQDLARLNEWVTRHANEGSTVICVYGPGSGDPYGLRPPAARSTVEPGNQASYLAISEDILYGYQRDVCTQVGGSVSSLNHHQCESLIRLRPFARVGRTILIYRVHDLPVDLKFGEQ